MLHGGCLCGAVRYQVVEPFQSFVFCHCSRCRKASGSAHTSNLRVAPTEFAWTSGQDLVVRFDLPSARSFSNTFCTRCGSPLPHLTRSGREVIVPAGSLDAEPAIRPQCHAHWSSRAAWTCSGDDLPRFPGAPS
ncbi:MAG: GFA family protein [Candidatus Binataceae bacterium]